MASVKIGYCVRTQLSVAACLDLDDSDFFPTFANTKGSKIKANSSNKSKLKYNINNIININLNIMEIISNIIETTLNSFDFAYCISVNILTYIIINVINSRNGNVDMKLWSKRIILIVSIIIVGAVYYFNGSDIKLIINSAILAPVFWSWIMKPICKYFKIDYKQLSLFE